MVAANDPPPRTKARQNVVLASAAAPAPRFRGSQPISEPMALGPSPAALTYEEDPLGPLILRSGMASSYLPTDRFTKAQHAANAMAGSAKKPTAAKSAPGLIVQLGAFRDPANAQRVADRFGVYGETEILDATSAGSAVKVVRVTVPRDHGPSELMSAAAEAGLNGSFVLGQ
jgi:hypothetical protein